MRDPSQSEFHGNSHDYDPAQYVISNTSRTCYNGRISGDVNQLPQNNSSILNSDAGQSSNNYYNYPDAEQYTNHYKSNFTSTTPYNGSLSFDANQWPQNNQLAPTSNSNVGQSNGMFNFMHPNAMRMNSGQFYSPEHQYFPDVQDRVCNANQWPQNNQLAPTSNSNIGQPSGMINSMHPNYMRMSSGQFYSPEHQYFLDVHDRVCNANQWPQNNQLAPTSNSNIGQPSGMINSMHPNYMRMSSGQFYSPEHQYFLDVQDRVYDVSQWPQTNPWTPTTNHSNVGQFYSMHQNSMHVSSGQFHSRGHQDYLDVHGRVRDTRQHTNQCETIVKSNNQNVGQSCVNNDLMNLFDENTDQIHSRQCQDLGDIYEKSENERSDETMHEENENFVEVDGINASDDVTVPIASEQSPVLLNIKLKHKRGCDNSKMFVRTSDDKPKKLVCPFCKKRFFKIPRHLEQKHNSEPDVKKFMSFQKGSKERRRILDALRNFGTFNWNKNAELNGNELIPSRRPNPKYKKTGADFTTCPYCLAPLTKNGLRYHVNYKCPNKPIINNKESECERVITALATAVEARIHVNASEKLEKIFAGFRGDNIVQEIRFDWLVTVYGNKLAEKYQEAKDARMIRSRIRLASRIIRALKDIEPDVKEFVELYNPKYFDSLIQAIKNVARVDNVRHEFEAPSTATDSITAIKQIGQMLITEYIKRDDQEGQRITKNFLTLVESDVPLLITKTVTRTQKRRKRQKRVILPSLGDVFLFRQYVDSEREKCFAELSDTFLYKTWKNLSELTMLSIIIFNRKRVGDAENIEVDDFTRREIIKDSSDHQMYQDLCAESKEIAKQFSRMQVSGKKDSDVYVLLEPEVEKAIPLLIKHREDACIPSDNKFLFALPSSLGKIKVLNGCSIVKRISSECKAKNPSALRGTLLRKQLATFCASIGLQTNQVEDVAEFMGHAKEVHLKVYRQNTIERQIVQISQILNAAQGNANNLICNPDRENSNKVKGDAVRKIKRLTTSVRGSKSKLSRAKGKENNLICNPDGENSNKLKGDSLRKIKRLTPSVRGSKRKSRGGRN